VAHRKKNKTVFNDPHHEESDIFTALLGKLGCGKTYVMIYAGLAALRANEPLFSNVALDLSGLSDLAGVKVYKSVEQYAALNPIPRGRCVVYWQKLVDLLHPAVRCGTILFDELGTLENCPWALEIKLLNLRKSHLSVYATVQNKFLAAAPIRRFFNRCLIVKQKSPPFLGLFYKDQRRPFLGCCLPNCTKDHGRLTRGDRPDHFPWRATHYLCRDVDPEQLGNKVKINSRGKFFVPFNFSVASTYQSAQAVGVDALTAWKQVKSKNYKASDYPAAPAPSQTSIEDELAKLPF
jgi:hypothetical protein